MTFKVLILGGTAEGRWLCERLRADTHYETLLSYAGRTEQLQPPGVPHRIGGFGGVEGLSAFLRAEGFAALVDATHPYAARISANAVAAAQRTGTPLLRLQRPPWPEHEADNWTHVSDMHEAARAIGAETKRVFLTVGRQETPVFASAPQHDYLVRAIDDFAHGLPRARLLLARGPFALADERALLETERIQLVVSKNAGTPATYAKIEAARALGIAVIMVARPPVPEAREVTTLDDVVLWLAALHGASDNLRGV
jgi:precorrin-6A/cobalt-precorrin-6A reductase